MYGDDYLKRPQYSADMIHREAMDWLDLRQSADKPFMGIFTYTLPHAELVQPNDSLLKGYKRKFFLDKTWGGQEASRYNPSVNTHAQFAAMISRLDAYVGEIMEKLDEKGLADNTIVVFTSDNGLTRKEEPIRNSSAATDSFADSNVHAMKGASASLS